MKNKLKQEDTETRLIYNSLNTSLGVKLEYTQISTLKFSLLS